MIDRNRERMSMRSYKVTFLTPAFLGNADQSGEWRTPPFKAMLRHWWRIAVARTCNENPLRIREAEGALFGRAWNDAGSSTDVNAESGFSKSLVRIRLDDWAIGSLKTVPDIGKVTMGKNSVPGAVYAGFGPVINERKVGPRLKANAAIQAETSSQLRLAFPESANRSGEIDRALALMDRFGTLGGRCRNGWGSMQLTPLDGTPELVLDNIPTDDWRHAIQRDWAHCIGTDSRGLLIWHSPAFVRWEHAMKCLAQARADMRRQVKEHLLLAYPSTGKTLPGWKNTDRVPHSLRFKVVREAQGHRAQITHLPCRPPDELWNNLPESHRRELVSTFSQAHEFLDAHGSFSRASLPGSPA